MWDKTQSTTHKLLPTTALLLLLDVRFGTIGKIGSNGE